MRYLFLIFTILFIISCDQKDKNPKKPIEESLPSSKGLPGTTHSMYKPSSEFDHIDHIRKHSRIGQLDGIDHDPKYFVDYTIHKLLKDKGHKKFITDRKYLRKLQNKICWDNYVLIKDTLLNGDAIIIELKTSAFDTVKHTVKRSTKSNFIHEIDGKYPYGAVYSKHPSTEIESLSITINGKALETSAYKYQNLYAPKFCNFGSYQRIVEAYEDGSYIYVYLFGGNAADSYFAKLIFDKSEGYITSIIADYGPLSAYGSFSEHFIGF